MRMPSWLWSRWQRVAFMPGCSCGRCGRAEPHEIRFRKAYTQSECRPRTQ